MFDKIEPIVFRAQFEKAVANLKWSITIENNEKEKEKETEKDNNNITNENLFDYESNSFDFKNITETRLPFNKRACMPQRTQQRKAK